MRSGVQYKCATSAFLYEKNANPLLLDDVMLVIDATGTSYTYDADGNLISAKDNAGRNESYTYSNAKELTEATTADNKNYSYTYHSSLPHRLLSATSHSSDIKFSFGYDGKGQLILVDARVGKDIVYNYDLGGNLTSVEEYNSGYSETATPDTVITYSYGNANWPDQLTSYNGESIVYDTIGNPTTYRGATLTWNGRRLTSYNGNGVTASYTYSEEDIRTCKTVNDVTTEYFLSGSTLLAEKTGDSITWFLYDMEGNSIYAKQNAPFGRNAISPKWCVVLSLRLSGCMAVTQGNSTGIYFSEINSPPSIRTILARLYCFQSRHCPHRSQYDMNSLSRVTRHLGHM